MAVHSDDVHYLMKTKGRKDTDIINKDRAATMWAEAAIELTRVQWQYVKVLQKDFEAMKAIVFADYAYKGRMQMQMFEE